MNAIEQPHDLANHLLKYFVIISEQVNILMNKGHV